MATNKPNEPLDILQAMVDDVLIQTGKALRAASRDGPKGPQATPGLKQRVDSSDHKFQCALDEIESTINEAKATLMRDLTSLRAKAGALQNQGMSTSAVPVPGAPMRGPASSPPAPAPASVPIPIPAPIQTPVPVPVIPPIKQTPTPKSSLQMSSAAAKKAPGQAPAAPMVIDLTPSSQPPPIQPPSQPLMHPANGGGRGKQDKRTAPFPNMGMGGGMGGASGGDGVGLGLTMTGVDKANEIPIDLTTASIKTDNTIKKATPSPRVPPKPSPKPAARAAAQARARTAAMAATPPQPTTGAGPMMIDMTSPPPAPSSVAATMGSVPGAAVAGNMENGAMNYAAMEFSLAPLPDAVNTDNHIDLTAISASQRVPPSMAAVATMQQPRPAAAQARMGGMSGAPAAPMAPIAPPATMGNKTHKMPNAPVADDFYNLGAGSGMDLDGPDVAGDPNTFDDLGLLGGENETMGGVGGTGFDSTYFSL